MQCMRAVHYKDAWFTYQKTANVIGLLSNLNMDFKLVQFFNNVNITYCVWVTFLVCQCVLNRRTAYRMLLPFNYYYGNFYSVFY